MPNSANRGCVLVVDDDPPVLRALERQVRSLGFTVVGTSSPEMALAVLEARHFDCLVSDLNISASGGVFVVEAARRAPTTPRIVVTGDDSVRHIHKQLLDVTIDGVLPKPFGRADLETALGRAIARVAPKADLSSEGRMIADGLVRALALRDIETEAHSRRVAIWTRLLADSLGLDASEAISAELGALLHDVGKIGVPDAILRKPGKLTEEEWVEMRKHPEHGRNMVSGIPLLVGAAEVVYSHHERFDGGGYPRKLRADAIAIGARIFAVVDTFDAMTSDRCYRKALRYEDAVTEITRFSGAQFDPRVVEAFLDYDRERWMLVRETVGDEVPEGRVSRSFDWLTSVRPEAA